MPRLPALVLLALLATGARAQTETLAYDGGWTERAAGEALVALPDGYDADPEARWPLLLFLHGAGERGDSLAVVGVHGPLKERRAGRDLPFVVVAPQVPEGQRWTTGRVVAALDDALDRYRVDADRVYLTGLSMGGYGTWEAIEKVPERFAAAVPVCGGGNRLGIGAARDVPVWAFHGAMDTVVPIGASVEMVRALREAGGAVRFTVYPDAGHDAWTETYANPAVYEWLLQHRISDRTGR
ncbi:prolyl oligopeptidase family serine peptidase [Rubrivirga litoralis]|uniref:Prolyl oligopeptidase family serine peptidase n=1 Tax=Rubrivirga litoralis TaxID=3075598 RepID=A0ABU3BNQ2_9BACT|nr:prolyl oligopeptidase family serine peptidase [Rubrivirga sp. F394]MDT0630893.1 prolyl oligopeptidase family serine peptidase [Rubrivirga sp. F394]